MNKAQMEKQWHQGRCELFSNLCAWQDNGKAKPGRHCASTTTRRLWLPPKPKNRPHDIEPSKELKARYKADCPNNYKSLITAFGRTRTKYDAPLDNPCAPLYLNGRDCFTQSEYMAGAGSPLFTQSVGA